VGPTAIYKPFFAKTSRLNSGSFAHPFFDPHSSMGSEPCHLDQDNPWAIFHPQPSGSHFSIPRSGTPAHVQGYQINGYMFDYLQILFTSGIWLSCVQVLGHHTLVQPLQVYNRHWHVIIPSESHLHLQSHPLKFSFRVPISGSVVLSPPLHFGYYHPVSHSPTLFVPFIAPLAL
jgi:hypothetical protein